MSCRQAAISSWRSATRLTIGIEMAPCRSPPTAPRPGLSSKTEPRRAVKAGNGRNRLIRVASRPEATPRAAPKPVLARRRTVTPKPAGRRGERALLTTPGRTSTHAPYEPVAQVVEHLTFNQVVLG